ncbi:MAG: primary-amine oxidase [Gammaproteobacteria bacterium]|nr:primary-amine oxidase [Gammaproteobacteria bacterium]
MPVHPLDPLSVHEIETAVALVREQEDIHTPFFSSVGLLEPEKSEVKAHQPGDGAVRVVQFRGVDEARDGGFQADVDLSTKQVDVKRVSLASQVPYSFCDFELAVRLTKTNAEWLAAARARGVAVDTEADLKRIQIDPWPGGGYPHPDVPQGHRAMRCIAFVRDDATDNGYAHPIDGLIAHVDITARKVACVEDFGRRPMPPEPGRFDGPNLPPARSGLQPLEIAQPQGTSFEVDGHRVRWQGYDFRVGIHPVHGLVLHQLSLNGRPLLYRAALSDMVVPYGDSDPMHSWKHVLDASEVCLGNFINSLKLGCDCLGEIHYFDINLINHQGKVRTVEHAICMHEEDYGIQWKHFDALSRTGEVRRSRRLVISSIFTIGNYDYGFFWYLYLDGTIQMEVKLTGIVGVSAKAEVVNASQSPQIAQNLTSPIHQHLFCFRLDWELDGGPNQLFENNIEVLPVSGDNPHGTQFRNVATHLTREQDAKRNVAPERNRSWKVVNPESKNGLGLPVAYKLLPQGVPTMFASADSPTSKRAAFARHNLWATPYAHDEIAASGANTVMHSGGGLPAYTADNRDISCCDLVMWHTIGVTHVPRPEDWPVMPVEYCGFHLIPVGFFDRNPTLDLPGHCD